MFLWLKNTYYRQQIKLLAMFKASVLFEKINQLDWYKKTLHQWIDDQKFSVNSKVLEVGCASGALTEYIAHIECIPTGVDSSEEMIALAKLNNHDIKFLVADAFGLPFEANSFDGVIAASLINIVDDKSKLMKELVRTCKKDGVITVLVPFAEFDDKDLMLLQKSLGISGFSFAAIEAWHNFPPKMEADEVTSLFNQAGLTEITIKKYLQGMVISVSAIKPS